MQEYANRIRLKFRLLAGCYDLFDIPFLIRPAGNPRSALARQIPNTPLRILDACVGTANSAITVAEKNGRNEIVGIDLSEDMIAVARDKIRKRDIRNITLHSMDATDMSFAEGAFDVVMISFALHELEYDLMLRILGELRRVVKKAGALYIIDYEREDTILKNLLLRMTLSIFEPRHLSKFLAYDWDSILKQVGFRLTATEKYLFSKLMCAVADA